MACGVEQSTVLPSLAVLGAATCALGYRLSLNSLSLRARERERRKRRAAVSLGLAQDGGRIEPKALGLATERSSLGKEKVEESSHVALRAIYEDRVVFLDRDGYLSARSHLRIATGCMWGISLAAFAQPGAGDLLFASFRLLLLLCLCIDFALTVPGQVATNQLFSAPTCPYNRASSGLTSQDHEPRETLLASLSGTLPFERLRFCALQLWALLMLIWFEVFRHPKLRESACHGEDVPLLLADRAAALTMTFAWLCATSARLVAWRCEACVWLAPRAEEILSEFVESDGKGQLLHGASCALAEQLCDNAEGWLRELQQMSLLVMDGSSQLVPASSKSEEILEAQREMQSELRRLTQQVQGQAKEERSGAPNEGRRSQYERQAAAKALPSKSGREELLKTKLDFARGSMATEGKPSDSGDSSSSPRVAAASRTTGGVVDPQRVALDLKGLTLAQLLEEAASAPQQHMQSAAKMAREAAKAVPEAAAPASAKPRAASQGATESRSGGDGGSTGARRPKRYSEMRKMSLEQRSSGRLSDASARSGRIREHEEPHDWTGATALPTVAPAPPSPPWNVQPMSSPFTASLEAATNNV